MLRIIFALFVFLHGLIHLLGFLKEWRLARVEQLTGQTLFALSAANDLDEMEVRVSALVISMFDTIPGLVLSGILAVLVTGATLWISDQRYSLGLARNIAIAFPQLAAFLKIQSAEIN